MSLLSRLGRFRRTTPRSPASPPAPSKSEPVPPRSFPVADVPPSLLDPAAEAQFRDLGYAVVDFCDPDATRRLDALAAKHHPVKVTTWASDFYHESEEAKREIGAGIRDAFADGMRTQLTGHLPVMTNFVVNWPGEDGGLVLHQHTSLVDEARFRSVILWVALDDCHEDNGTLHVVPRSHHVPQRCWGEGEPDWFRPHLQEVHARHLASVEVRAGQALVFDNALLHCSFANRTDRPRRTAVAIATPVAADLRYYSWTEREELEVYGLEPDFFFRRRSSDFRMADPEGLPLVDVVPAPPVELDVADLDALVPAPTCHHVPLG